MILLHKSLKRSDDFMRSLRRFFEVNCKTIDGVIEVFNNKIGQGFMLKIYESYNKDNDLVIWIFESLKEKNIQIAYSNLSNVDEYNNWIHNEQVNFKCYPIIKDIKKQAIRDIHSIITNYYDLNEDIEISKRINI